MTREEFEDLLYEYVLHKELAAREPYGDYKIGLLKQSKEYYDQIMDEYDRLKEFEHD